MVGVKPYGNTIPSGTTVKGAWGGGATTVGPNDTTDFLVTLPAPAPVALTDSTVNFGVDESDASDADIDCDGDGSASDKLGFVIEINKPTSATADTVNTIQAHGTWAYTAP